MGILVEGLADLQALDSGSVEERASAIASWYPPLAAHGRRVSALASRIVDQLRPEDAEMRAFTRATAHLHDLGKLAISQKVLDQPSRLSPEQRAHVERHAAIGANLTLALGFTQDLSLAVRSHHEWWNGEGYPDRLKATNIPFASRVIGVADAFDAMTSTRPYRKALALDAALHELERCSGTQFDPEIVAIVLSLYEMPHSSRGA